VTSLGIGVEENWNNVQGMKTGIARIPDDDLPLFMQYIRAESLE